MNSHLSSAQLTDYLHRELLPGDDARVHAHLAGCAQCAAELERETTLSDLLQRAAAAETLEWPAGLSARIWQEARAERPSFAQSLATWWRPALAVPAAAVLVLGVWFATPALHPQGAPGIAASYYLIEHAAEQSNPLTDRNSHSTLLLDESDNVSAGGSSGLSAMIEPVDLRYFADR